jgi:two-component system chemotaxis response regulator CheY
MLIDDSRTMRGILRGVVTRLGCTGVCEACDGQDALSRVGAFRPDLILVDWYMPVMDGLSFVREFRRLNKVTPIIMVTVASERSRVLEAIRAGVNEYVVKPFTPELLTRRIAEALEGRGKRGSAGGVA